MIPLQRSLGTLLLGLTALLLACDEGITPTNGDNQPPTVTITAPSDSAVFEAGDSVLLRGTAEDPEDGTLPDSMTGWASDLDGELGAGAELTVTDLSVGLHQISFGALDSQGAGDTASIRLVVANPPAGVVINEVENRHLDGPRHTEDWVELYVTRDGTLDSASLELVAMDGTVYGETDLSGVVVDSGDFVLVGADSVTDADVTFVGLQDGPGAARVIDASGDTADAVEWGGAGLGAAETSPVAGMPAHMVIQRAADGGDTDDNAADFCAQGEADASPGAANAACPTPDAALEVQFFDRFSGRDVQEVVLADSTYWVVDFAVRNMGSLASASTTGLTEDSVLVSDTSVVEVMDLPPAAGDSTLAPGDRVDDAVVVICRVDDGQATVSKTVTASNDPVGPAVDRVDVTCDPSLLPDGAGSMRVAAQEAGPPVPTPPETPPAQGTLLGVDIYDVFGNEPLPSQDMVEGQTVEGTFRMVIGHWNTDETAELWPAINPGIDEVDAASPEMSIDVSDADAPAVLFPEEEWVTPLSLTCNTAYEGTSLNHVEGGALGVIITADGERRQYRPRPETTIEATCTSPPAIVAGQTEFDESGSDSGQGGLVIMRSDGAGGYQPPDFLVGPVTDQEFFAGMPGQSFVFARADSFGDPTTANLWHAEDDGSGLSQLTSQTAFYRRGSANADGTRYVFESDRDDPKSFAAFDLNDVFVMNADGSGVTSVLTEAGYPSFTPDGRIVYAADADNDGHSEIRIADADGSNAALLIDDDAANSLAYSYPVVSPDGSRIAVARENTDTFEIFVMVGDFDGTSVTNLQRLEMGGSSDQPAWSPSGDRIAFTSIRDGNQVDVFVANADGSNVINVSQTPEKFESDPFWIP